VRSARKTAPPPSWLNMVREASAAFVGKARVVSDDHVDASATSFRGEGWRVRAEVTPQWPIFGEPPAGPLTLTGDTPYPPDRRIDLSQRIPPDVLRQVDYWDCARAGDPQAVLAIIGSKASVFPVAGPDDELAASVRTVRDWLQLPVADRVQRIIQDLSRHGQSAVSWGVGAELILAESPEPANDLARLLDIRDRPVGALRAVAAAVQGAQSPEFARLLLDRWPESGSSTEEQAAVLAWFENHRSAWQSSDEVSQRVRKLAQAASPEGQPESPWAGEIATFASALS
jgi:hypothetical protein